MQVKIISGTIVSFILFFFFWVKQIFTVLGIITFSKETLEVALGFSAILLPNALRQCRALFAFLQACSVYMYEYNLKKKIK